jgi:dipeptidase E
MNGKLFLGGGGNTEQSKALDSQLTVTFGIERRPTCLYVPVAMEESKHEDARQWFIGSYEQAYATIETLSRLSDLDHGNVFDVIYIGGGNTGRLLDCIYEAGFEKYLLKHLGEGRAVYGGSAGAIVLGRTILTADPMEHSMSSNDGLNLLDGRAVVAHYNDGVDRERVSDLSTALNCALVAIPEDAGVVVSGLKMTGVGSSDVLVFEPSRMPHALGTTLE